MLVDTRLPQNPGGFNANVDNTQRQAKASFGQKFGWILLVIFTLGIIWFVSISWKNNLINEQMQINNAASNIQVNEAKRRDTLIKLLEQTKGYMKHEKETLTLVTKYRSGGTDSNETAKLDNQLANFMMNLNVQYEQYPQLKADSLVRELMSSSQYLETEIAAARRLYNQKVSYFNAEIFMFPKIVLASKIGLSTFALFQATSVQRQDVDMSSLSNYDNPNNANSNQANVPTPTNSTNNPFE
ncbi:MAG: LemA family protein [Malacoplasma sp.]|nr:LemA family protein [Malacoplasma sp.]MDE5774950.1 LemA family protein [Malacoplasma sp.]MDE7099693.1 LemA family protein [Malacoplasma sp.]